MLSDRSTLAEIFFLITCNVCVPTSQIPLLPLFLGVFTVAGQIYASALHLTSSSIIIRLPVTHSFTHGLVSYVTWHLSV